MAVQPQNQDLLIQFLETQSELLQLASMELRDAEVIKTGNRLLAQLRDLWNTNRDRSHLQLVRLRMAAVVSKSLRRAGKVQDALTLCEELLDDAEFAMLDSYDNRAAERALASLAAELGRCHLDLAEYEEAEQHLRDAMVRLRRSFIFDGTPKEFSQAYMRASVGAIGQKAVHDQMDPAAFAQYARTQASLADVLRITQDSQTAFTQADEAVRTCYALVMLFPEFPAYLADTVACTLVLAKVEGLPDGSSTLRQSLLGEVVAATTKGNWHHAGAAEFLQDLSDLQRIGTP